MQNALSRACGTAIIALAILGFHSSARAQCADPAVIAQARPLVGQLHSADAALRAQDYKGALETVTLVIPQLHPFISQSGPCGDEAARAYEHALSTQYFALSRLNRLPDAVPVMRELAISCRSCSENDRSTYYSMLGLLLLNSNHSADALDSYRMALSLNPSSIEANYGQGNALEALGRSTEAVTAYKRTMGLAGSGERDQKYAALARQSIAGLSLASKAQETRPATPASPRDGEVSPGLIFEIQELLSALGYDPGSTDGEDTAETRLAIRDYQTRTGLDATGAPTEALLSRLAADKGGTGPTVSARPGAPSATGN